MLWCGAKIMWHYLQNGSDNEEEWRNEQMHLTVIMTWFLLMLTSYINEKTAKKIKSIAHTMCQDQITQFPPNTMDSIGVTKTKPDCTNGLWFWWFHYKNFYGSDIWWHMYHMSQHSQLHRPTTDATRTPYIWDRSLRFPSLRYRIY